MRLPKVDFRFLFHTPKNIFKEKIYIFNAYLLDKYPKMLMANINQRKKFV